MQLKKSIVLSMATSVLLVMSGCSSDSRTDENGDTGSGTGDTIKPITIGGKAIDGYLRFSTVCLDLDNNGYCQIGDEPAASTKSDGSYEMTATAAHQAHPNFATANLIVFGGQDSDTGKDFNNKLVAAFDKDNTGEVFITPLTTMVAAVKDSTQGVTKEEAETKVAAMLGLKPSDMNADPVAKAKAGDRTILSAALELQKSVEVLASASGGDEKKATENVFKALAEGVKDLDVATLDTATATVNTLLGSVDRTQLGVDATKAVDAAIVLAKNVAAAVDAMESGVDASLAVAAVANTIDNVQKQIEKDVQDNDGVTAVPENAATDVNLNFNVSTTNVTNVIVYNVIVNETGVELSDEQLAALVAAGVGYDSDLDDISKKIETSDDGELASIGEKVEDAVEQQEEEKALLAAVDTDTTLQSILASEGVYSIHYDYSRGGLEIQKHILEDDLLNDYQYDFETSTFVLDTNEEDSSEQYYQEIVMGASGWEVESESENNKNFEFTNEGDLVFYDNFTRNVLSVNAFNATGLKIANIYQGFFGLNIETLFSTGAKYYSLLETKETISGAAVSSDEYRVWYQPSGSWNEQTQVWTPDENPTNDNYEREHTEVGYSTLVDFMTAKSTTAEGDIHNKSLNLHYYDDQEEKHYNLRASLAENGVLNIVREYWDDVNQESIEEVGTSGTYELKTLGSKEVLVLTPPDIYRTQWEMDQNRTQAYYVHNGEVLATQVSNDTIDYNGHVLEVFEQNGTTTTFVSLSEIIGANKVIPYHLNIDSGESYEGVEFKAGSELTLYKNMEVQQDDGMGGTYTTYELTAVMTSASSYMLETIGTEEVLSITIGGEKLHQILLEVNNQVVQTYMDMHSNTIQYFGNPERYYAEVAYTSLNDFIASKALIENNHNGLWINGNCDENGCQNLVGFLAEDSVLAVFDRNDDNGEMTPADLNGTYERKTVNGEDILIMKLPSAYQNEWMKDRAHEMFTVYQDRVSRGEYAYAPYISDGNSDTQEQNLYNLVAVEDIIAASTTINTSGKACMATHTNDDETSINYCMNIPSEEICKDIANGSDKDAFVAFSTTGTCQESGYENEFSPEPGQVIFVDDSTLAMISGGSTGEEMNATTASAVPALRSLESASLRTNMTEEEYLRLELRKLSIQNSLKMLH